MNAIDTNIWIYRHDSRDPQKQRIADQLILSVRPQVLLWQIGCEFIAASRKLAVLGFTEDHAWAALADMQSIAVSVALSDVRLWSDAHVLQTLHSLSFWDALLIAACTLSGVRTLYTENMGAPRTLDGLSLVNPFLPRP
jgi:predicted nucleic acid-binding protein